MQLHIGLLVSGSCAGRLQVGIKPIARKAWRRHHILQKSCLGLPRLAPVGKTSPNTMAWGGFVKGNIAKFLRMKAYPQAKPS
jgi:hypothetical protein